MDLDTFLQRVLPSNGTDYFGATITNNGALQQSKLESVEALVRYINNNHRKDTFFATGSYKGARTAEKAELRKTFFVDLDVGPETHKYPDKRVAVKELLGFCKDHFIKPSLIVDSGGGIHAYWVLDTPIPPARWKPLAEAFKQLHEDVEFKADTACTADLARVLRAPFTVNYKYSSPRTTKVLFDGADVTLKDIEDKLNVQQPTLTLASVLPVNDDDLQITQDYADKEQFAKNIVQSCPMFKEAFETGGEGVSEKLWQEQLHVLAFCEDGEEYAHEISKNYSGYSYAETQAKFSQKLSKKDSIGPVRCETFAKSSAKCQGCEFYGDISTPLQLGGDRDPTMPWPYRQDENGVFFFSKTTAADYSVEFERIDVMEYNIEDFTLAWAGVGTPIIAQFTAKDKHRDYEVEIDVGAEMTDTTRFVDTMSRSSVLLHKREIDKAREMIMAWAKHIQRRNKLGKYSTHLGWVENSKAFATAYEIIYADHSIKNQFNAVKNLASLYKPTGEAEPWVKIAHRLTAQKRHEIDAIILTAFAAPLMHMMGDPAAILAFVSQESGSGKTSAMQVAQSVWGHPIEATNQLDDTQNAILKKMGFIRNIPAYWDEVRAKHDATKFLSLILQLTAGKERARMSRNTDLQETLIWNTILTVASNESIADHANYASSDTEAGRVRVFEVVVPPISQEQNISVELLNLRRDLMSNYGVIGPAYAQYLVRNFSGIKGAVEKLYQQLSIKLLNEASERFWLSTITALIVACQLANKLGYVNIDTTSFTRWVIQQFEKQREGVEAEYSTSENHSTDLVKAFLSEHTGSVLVCDYLTKPGTGDNGRIYTQPRDDVEVVATVATKDKTVRISTRVLREWGYKRKHGGLTAMLAGFEHDTGRRAVGLKGTIAGMRTKSVDIKNYDFSDETTDQT